VVASIVPNTAVAWFTSSIVVALAVVKFDAPAPVGVKLAERVCAPDGSTIPVPGLYANVPGTETVPFVIVAVALNWMGPSAVPTVIAASGPQLIVGVACVIVRFTPVAKLNV